VILNADPHLLFGPTDTRIMRMPLVPCELNRLIDWVGKHVAEQGCDQSARFARSFLEQNHLPIASTLTALLAQGGGCDCEIVLNVRTENVYPRDVIGAA